MLCGAQAGATSACPFAGRGSTRASPQGTNVFRICVSSLCAYLPILRWMDSESTAVRVYHSHGSGCTACSTAHWRELARPNAACRRPLVSGPARLRALGGPRTRSSRVCGARWVAGRYASGGKIIMRILLPCSRSPFVNHWQDAWCMISCDVECQCGQRATEDKSGRRSWGCRAVLSQNGYIRF